MSSQVWNPDKPDFFAEILPQPNVTNIHDWSQAYEAWAERSGVLEWVQGARMRAVATNLRGLLEEPIAHGMFQGKRRFVSEHLAKKLGVPASPFPREGYSWTAGPVPNVFAALAYTQGSSEFGSSQQQYQLLELGHVPPILDRYIRSTVIEEGEHGFQMAAWLLLELGGDLGGLLAEDLLARSAGSDDPKLQQPLVEFNPPVLTLPEFGHYLDKQDRDGWSQLQSSVDSANALYAGMMRFFLRQEARHMRSGEQVIDWYLRAGKIPMDLHIKMELGWDAITYRLHGNPLGSTGALTAYRLGTKNPIFPLARHARLPRYARMSSFAIPHPDKEGGYQVVELNEQMEPSNLNGYSVSVLRNILLMNNAKRSELLSPRQHAEMRHFLKTISHYVPDEQRKPIVEGGVIPTAALSWRPDHLAYELENDGWRHMRNYVTDVFGNPIPSMEEYRQYRELVELSDADRQRIRDITAEPGWMVEEVKPGSRGDVYSTGLVKPTQNDTVLYEFTVGDEPRNRTIFTMPQAIERMRERDAAERSEPLQHESQDGLDFLHEVHGDLIK